MSFLKLRILLDGDVESNPGPTYKILKTVQGSFHQADPRFRETAGRQCACNALYSITWSVIRRIGLWNTSDLDFILFEGDKLYKNVGATSFLSADDLPQSVDVENNKITVEKLRFYQSDIMKYTTERFLTQSFNSEENNGDGFLLFIDGFTMSVIWNKAYFFLFDSHSRNIDGKISENGSSILLKFRSLNAAEKYIKEIYFSNKQLEQLRFEIQYIKINISSASTSDICTSHKKRKYMNSPEHERTKKRMRQNKAQNYAYSDKIGTPQHENRKEQMKQYSAVNYSYSDILCTSQHENRKDQWKEYSAVHFSKMLGTRDPGAGGLRGL